MITNVLTLIPCLVFIFIVIPNMPYATYISYTVSTLLALTMIALWQTALQEPGIIPRNPKHVSPEMPPAGADMGINGWKLCETCNVYRPPRAKHCTFCNNCVEELDHHCPWTGNCVAKRNYKYFFRFLLLVTILVMVVTVIGIWSLILAFTNASAGVNVFEILGANIVGFIVTIFTFICTCSLWSLCGYHVFLLQCIGQVILFTYLVPRFSS